MSRVKFSVNTEYAYLQNFKILQSTYQRRVRMPSQLSSHSYKMPLRSTKSSGPSLSSPWSSARCKIILSSFNGQSVTGTSTIQVATTMLLPDGKELEALPQLLPQHQSLLVRLVLASAPPALLGVVLPQRHQQPQQHAEQDSRRGVHPRLSWRKTISSSRRSRGWRENEISISANFGTSSCCYSRLSTIILRLKRLTMDW